MKFSNFFMAIVLGALASGYANAQAGAECQKMGAEEARFSKNRIISDVHTHTVTITPKTKVYARVTSQSNHLGAAFLIGDLSIGTSRGSDNKKVFLGKGSEILGNHAEISLIADMKKWSSRIAGPFTDFKVEILDGKGNTLLEKCYYGHANTAVVSEIFFFEPESI